VSSRFKLASDFVVAANAGAALKETRETNNEAVYLEMRKADEM